MKSEFDKQNFAKLNSILFTKNKHIPQQSQKQKLEPEPKETNNNLQQQMQTLKLEVQTMLDTNHNENVEKVVRSTTRHYLERIRNLSVQLPESLQGFKDAAETFLQSLPLRRRPLMNTQRCITIERRLSLKYLFKCLRPHVSNIYKVFFIRARALIYRKQRTNQNLFVSQLKKKILAKCFASWRYSLDINTYQKQHEQIIESLRDTIDMSQILFSEQQIVLKLEKIISQYATCQLFIVNGVKIYTYLENKQNTIQHQKEDLVFESSQSNLSNPVIRHEIQLKQSLTKICIMNKEIIQTNFPNSDPDFAAIDLPITVQSGPRHPLLFVPIVNNNQVIAILRCFWYPVLPNKFQLPLEMIEFVKSTIQTSLTLGKIVQNFKQTKQQEQKEINYRFLEILELIEISNQSSMNKVFQKLKSIIECQTLTTFKFTNQELQIVFSSNNTSKEGITQRINLEKGKATNIHPISINDKILGYVEIVNPSLKSNQIYYIFKLIFERLENLRIKQLEEQSIQRMHQKQQKTIKKLKLQKIMRIGFSELTSFSLLNISKVLQLMASEINLLLADVFIKVGNQFISGYKHLQNTPCFIPQQLFEILKKSKIESSELEAFQITEYFGYQKTKESQVSNIEFFNVFIDQSVQIIISLGRLRSQQEDTLIVNVLQTFSQWVGHLTLISGVNDGLFVKKLNKEFMSSITNRNMFGVVKSAEQIFNSTTQMISKYIGAQCLKPLFQQVSDFSNKIQILLKKGYIYSCSSDKLLFREQTKNSKLYQISSTDQEVCLILQQLNVKFSKGCYLHFTILIDQFVIFIINDVSIGIPGLIYSEIQKFIKFQNKFSIKKDYEALLDKSIKEDLLVKTFYSLHQTVQKSAGNLFYTHQNSYKNGLAYTLHKLYKNRLLSVIAQLENTRTFKKYKKRQLFTNFVNITKLSNSISLCLKVPLVQSFQLINKKSISIYSKEKAVRNLTKITEKIQKKTYGLFLYNLKITYKPPNTAILNIYRLFDKRISLGLIYIKSHSYHPYLPDNSLIRSFSFPSNFKLLRQTLLRSRECSNYQLLIQNKQKNHLISLNPSNTFQILSYFSRRCYRVECSGFNLIWKLKQSQTLSFESKQHLETVSKIVSENIKAYQELIFPIFCRLNVTLRSSMNKAKANYYRRWRDVVLHTNKLRQYNNIQKVYRLENQIKIAAEIKQRREEQIVKNKQQFQMLKERLNNSQKVLQVQKKQIVKIQKYRGAYQLMNCFTEILKREKLKDCLWNLWKLSANHSSSEQSRYQVQTKHRKYQMKKTTMLQQGLKQMVKIFSDKNKELKNFGLKEIIVNCIKYRQLIQQTEAFDLSIDRIQSPQKTNYQKGAGSPVDCKQYSQLILQQRDQNSEYIKNIGHHIRMPTYSSIANESETSKIFNQETQYQTRYCSFNHTKMADKSLSVKFNHHMKDTSLQKQNLQQHVNQAINTSNDNYFNPIPDIKQKMITNSNLQVSSIQNNISIDMRSESMSKGYKLNDKTLRFLKRFGRRLNVTEVDIQEEQEPKAKNNKSVLH